MKQTRILIIVIAILLIILGIKISGVKMFKQKDEVTLEQIKELIAKSENITNYYCESEGDANALFKSIKRRDNIKVEEPSETSSNNNIEYIWINDDENKVIVVGNAYHKDYPNKKIAIVEYTDSYKGNYYPRILFNSILKGLKKFEYKKEENYNGYNCIVVNFKDEENNKVELWIDKEYGFIMREIVEKNGEKTADSKFNYKFNCITEDDVKEPDLSNYAIEGSMFNK